MNLKESNSEKIARALVRACAKYQGNLEKRSRLTAAEKRQLLRLRLVRTLVFNKGEIK